MIDNADLPPELEIDMGVRISTDPGVSRHWLLKQKFRRFTVTPPPDAVCPKQIESAALVPDGVAKALPLVV